MSNAFMEDLLKFPFSIGITHFDASIILWMQEWFVGATGLIRLIDQRFILSSTNGISNTFLLSWVALIDTFRNYVTKWRQVLKSWRNLQLGLFRTYLDDVQWWRKTAIQTVQFFVLHWFETSVGICLSNIHLWISGWCGVLHDIPQYNSDIAPNPYV